MEGSHNAAAPTSNASTASSPCLQKRTATLELFNMCLVDPAPQQKRTATLELSNMHLVDPATQQKRTATLELSNMRLVDPATPKKRACTRGVGCGVDEAGVGCGVDEAGVGRGVDEAGVGRGVDEAGVYLPYNVNAGYPPSLKLGCCKENVSDPPLLMLPPPCLAACSQVADEDTMSESNQGGGGGGGGLDFKLSVKLFSGANEADGQEDQQLALLEIVVDGGNVVVGGDVDGDKREHHIAVLDRSRSMEGPRMKNLISALVTYIEVCVYWFCFLIGRSIYV